MSSCYDAIVVGAGIVGAACAAEFGQAGLSVALVEPDVIGGGATAAGMGHLAVMDDSEAQFALTRYSQVLWREIAPRLPAEAEYFPCGALWVAADDDEMAEVDRKLRYYSDRGVPAETLDARALADAEPHLRPGLAGGLLLSDDGVVYPPCAARFLVDEARRSGAELIAGRSVAAFADGSASLDDGSKLAAGFIVLATGAAAGRMLPGLDIHPRKGHLLITDRYPGLLRHQLIELGYLKSAHSAVADSAAFNAQPRVTGQVLLGSSRQYGSENPAIDSHMLTAMLRRAIEYMPALRDVSAIRCWTGFRAATPDKLPLIGVCPRYRFVYLATGHEGLGISTSLATGRLLADMILDRKSDRLPVFPARVSSLISESISSGKGSVA
jgi:glycine/D-amino acid oxidase-like deaminating enzyme